MTPRLPDGDTIVAMAGLVMSLFLVSRSSALQQLSGQRRVVYAVVWAVLIGALAALAARFGG
ncbi:hypothetical protein ACFOON_16940 [Novosphingobium piscinae]|uniref:Uncharacterized protein n=1 Tax=Novosphingobium piscinae TaxID=1507448 RepID=A0A7X1KQ67_9SPHN|nr:hypothetical protein [Novosphingobium piscinae]MBC2669477.1 hypothetical protein [Novosphingobium piscinae]